MPKTSAADATGPWRCRIPGLRLNAALNLLRATLGLFMVAHGATRVVVGTVGEFGDFLALRGVPAGHALAFFVTGYEVLGGVSLAGGLATRCLALGFVVEHLMGIVLVHGRIGWFTVGYQTGGAEYSVLLIVCFLLSAVAADRGEESFGGHPG